jgi:hypothetical protein
MRERERSEGPGERSSRVLASRSPVRERVPSKRPRRLLDVGKELSGHSEEPSGRRVDRELAARDFERRREGHSGRLQADGITRPDLERRVEIESHAGRSHVEHLARGLPANLELVLLGLEPLLRLAGIAAPWRSTMDERRKSSEFSKSSRI